jgi:signal transduction histidine kinase/ligand-binding sensor domain-containing protein
MPGWRALTPDAGIGDTPDAVKTNAAGSVPEIRAGAGAVLALTLASLPCFAADEAGGDRWAALAPPVFQLVASSRGLAALPYTENPTALAQDAAGFLWVGTIAGLERWDGHEFVTYVAKPGDPCALPDDYVEALHLDSQGRLLVGTGSAGLFRHDPETDCFRPIPLGLPPSGSAYVKAIADDGAGGLWVGTTAGLDHVAADLKSAVSVSIATGHSTAGDASSVLRVLRDARGALWVATEGSLLRRGPGQTAFADIPLSPGNSPALIRALLIAADGRIWAGTSSGGVYVIDPVTLQPLAVPVGPELRAAGPFWDAAQAPDGEIWFATHGTGIVAIDPASLRVRTLRRQRGVPTSLLDDWVDELFRDRDGLMWVACENGLGFFGKSAAAATIITAGTAGGLPEGTVSALTALGDGRIAVGSRRDIVLIGPQAAVAEPVPLNLPQPLDGVFALTSPNGRDLFAGIRPVGLVWIDRAARRAVPVPLPGPRAVQRVLSLASDPDHVWVGALDGVWRLGRPAAGVQAPVPWRIEHQYALPSVFAIASSGTTHWLASKRGLFRAVGDAEAEHLQFVSGGTALPSEPFLLTLLVDRRHRLWAGSTDQGLFVLDPSTASGGHIRVLRHLQDELPNPLVDALLEDDRGMIWVSTDRGLARIDPDTFEVRRLGRADGVVVTDYWSGSAVATAHGELLFGGQSGLTILRPAQIGGNRPGPRILITGISLGGRALPADPFNQPRDDRALEVPADARSVSVDFVALDYADPDVDGYAYLLEGYDRDWIRTDAANRMARYTNLAPGTYRLRLREMNRGEAAAGPERQLIVRVAAAWYQMMWFHVLEAAAVLVALVLIVQTRTVLLRARQRELQSLVDERTQALIRATGERNALIENIAHDLRTPLTSLRGYLDRLSLGDASLTEADRSRFIGIAVRQTERLIRLVRELFELVRLQDPLARLNLERFSPAEIVQDVVQEFASIAEGRTISCELDGSAESVQIVGDISLFQRLIENLVDNALRHTPADGRITVRLATAETHIVLEVRDTGRGIDRVDLDRIFNRYQRGDTAGSSHGAGLGLAIVKRILELHQGSVVVDSEVGVGTRFTARLPRVLPAAESAPG